jgi:hypothetical protein
LTHWQVFAVHVKFSKPAPPGHPQFLVPPHPFEREPHADPSACAGHADGAQQTFGFATVLQTSPCCAQLHVSVPPHPFENEPHASPPTWPGPFGTFAQV